MITPNAKLLFADMDGTALRRRKDEPTQRVTDAVVEFEDQGGIFVPVTTRSDALMKRAAASMRLRGLGVLDGGATIFNFATAQRLPEYTRWLGLDKIRKIVSAIGPLCTEISYEVKYRAQNPKDVVIAAITEAAPSVFVVFENDHEETIAERVRELEVDGHPNAYEDSATHRCMQIVYAGVGKQAGIKTLLDGPYADIAPHNTAGIGDGETDLRIYAALPDGATKLAMDNAHPSLIAAADYVVPHVDNDGLQVAIDGFMRGAY
ncbi:MAG TPA: HAD hydrolase family protein [Candidatus Saccharimonadales bacterium]|nr:HAD hydrolase family protein [Candidatus Saccharimonadales bacterium]